MTINWFINYGWTKKKSCYKLASSILMPWFISDTSERMLYTILTYDLKTKINKACFDCIGVDPFNGGSGNNGNGV